jgi:hypothetical protein
MKSAPVLLVAALLVGCGGDPAPLTPSQYFQQRADAVCSAVERACLLDVARCSTARLGEYMAEANAAVGSFREFIPVNAEACIAKTREVYGKIRDGMVAMPPADYQAVQVLCGNVYRGATAENGPCHVNADCLGSLVCDKGYCGTPKLVVAGGGCANIGEYCPAGSYCSPGNGVWMCTSKVGLLASCLASPCLESLRCAAGFCAARLPIGEACLRDDECQEGICHPYAAKCAADIRFADGNSACLAMAG